MITLYSKKSIDKKVKLSTYFDDGYLHLDQPTIENPNICSKWTEEFDRLDSIHNIYTLTTKMYFCTDDINNIPSCFKKFKNVREMTIEGSRFCYATMENLPVSVEVLRFDTINLNDSIFKGMEKLTNLTTLYIEYTRYSIPIYNLNSLKTIHLRYDIYDLGLLKYDLNDDLVKSTITDFMEKFVSCDTISNIKHRVDRIENFDNGCSIIYLNENVYTPYGWYISQDPDTCKMEFHIPVPFMLSNPKFRLEDTLVLYDDNNIYCKLLWENNYKYLRQHSDDFKIDIPSHLEDYVFMPYDKILRMLEL